MNRYLILLSLAFCSITSAFSLKTHHKTAAFSQSSEQLRRKPLTRTANIRPVSGLLSIVSSLENEIPHHTSLQASQSHPGLAPHKLNVQQFVYVVLTSIFVTCLIIADVIGVKIFELKLPFPIFGHTAIEHTCGMITFPITFLLGDVINEYYGAKAAKDTIYIGLAMSILVFGVMNFAQALPYLQKPFNVTPQAFNMIFGSAKLMYVASICAYLIGQLSDVWLFGVIKRITKGNYLWLRATGSTLISQMLDSFVVSYMAFSFGKTVTNQIPATMREVMNIAITGYGLKFVISLLITPILYLVRNFLHDRFGFRPLPPDYVDE